MAKKIKLLVMIFVSLISLIAIYLTFSYVYINFLKMAYPTKYEEYVAKASTEYNVKPQLIYAIIKTESNFISDAKSHAGAIGLMQLTPDTFNWLQMYTNDAKMDEDLLKDPEININYGVLFISMLIERYGSEDVAICAYNAGIGNVNKWLSNSKTSIDGQTLISIPFKETREYLFKTMKAKEIYERLYYSHS